jgi:NADPH-dependent 2,4-dienoyl-CoA reductase/sulfur reductase-like enzyme
MTDLLIIGGSDAGISAALRAREVDPGTRVIVVVADEFPNYSICGLPFFLSGETPDWRDLAHRKTADLERAGMTLKLNHRALSIDAVRIAGPDGDEEDLPCDRLVVGTGAVSTRPDLPGLDLPGVFFLRWMQDAFALRERLDAGPRNALIVGGGYIGLEMADALTRRGMEVTLVEAAPAPLTTVDVELGEVVGRALEDEGVEVICGTGVEAIEPSGDRLRVRGNGGLEKKTDLVLVVTGSRPETRLAETAGVTLGEGGAIRVNRRMETGVDGIWAAGDCVETWHRIMEKHIWLPLGTTAHKQGRVAGENAVGGRAEFAGSLGTQVVKVFDLVAARTGLRHDEAARAGFDPRTVETAVDDHKAYYPGAGQLRIRVTGDKVSGRLLGAQILGPYGSEISKRIDVFAAALFHGMRVEELLQLDLSYTPPLSSPWDPVQMGAQAWLAGA